MKILFFVFSPFVGAARIRRPVMDHRLLKLDGTSNATMLAESAKHEARAATGGTEEDGCCSWDGEFCGNTTDYCRGSPSQCAVCTGTWCTNCSDPYDFGECKLSEPMMMEDGTTLQMFLLGIDAACCREAQAIDPQSRMDDTAEEPECVTQASNPLQRGVLNGFDCKSNEAIKCGNESAGYVVAKASLDCCPFLEATFLAGADTVPIETCEQLNLEDGFCIDKPFVVEDGCCSWDGKFCGDTSDYCGANPSHCADCNGAWCTDCT